MFVYDLGAIKMKTLENMNSSLLNIDLYLWSFIYSLILITILK